MQTSEACLHPSPGRPEAGPRLTKFAHPVRRPSCDETLLRLIAVLFTGCGDVDHAAFFLTPGTQITFTRQAVTKNH